MLPNSYALPQDPCDDPELSSYEVVNETRALTMHPDWHRDYPDWSFRRPGQRLDGNALCRLLAELDDLRRHGRTLDSLLLEHVARCIEEAPCIPLRLDARGWRDTAAAQRVLNDNFLLDALDSELQFPAIEELRKQLAPLKKPKLFAAAQTIELRTRTAETVPAPAGGCRPWPVAALPRPEAPAFVYTSDNSPAPPPDGLHEHW